MIEKWSAGGGNWSCAANESRKYDILAGMEKAEEQAVKERTVDLTAGPGTEAAAAKGGGAPAYLRIADTIAERLSSGVYRPGSRLPSESQFCAEFGVSPMTLRRSLAMLTERGLISTQKGRGTFARSLGLTDSVFTVEQLMGGWLEDSAEVRLLSAATTRAAEQVAAKLQVAAGSRVVRLCRLVLTDARPAVYHEEYVIFDPRRPLVESQLQLTSWQGVLQAKRGQGFPRGEVALGAIALDAEAARVLGERPGTPALCMEHLFQGADRSPVSWGRFLLRADLFRLRARLGPD